MILFPFCETLSEWTIYMSKWTQCLILNKTYESMRTRLLDRLSGKIKKFFMYMGHTCSVSHVTVSNGVYGTKEECDKQIY